MDRNDIITRIMALSKDQFDELVRLYSQQQKEAAQESEAPLPTYFQRDQ